MGLCLVNTSVVAIPTSSVVVAQDDIRQARNALNQIWWRINANNAIVSMNTDIGRIDELLNKKDEYFRDRCLSVKQNRWITNDKFRESIIKVIGKAIGDCVTGEGAFAKKAEDGVVTFEKTKLATYSPENWNAVMLYNYVNVRISTHQSEEQDGKKWTDRNCLEYCYNAVFQHYATNYKNIYDTDEKVEQLDKDLFTSLLDIDAYNRALGLGKKLAEVARAAYYYDPDNPDWDKAWMTNFIAPDLERYRWDQNFAQSTPSKYEIKLQISHKLTEKEAQLAKDNNVYISNEFSTLDYLTGYDYVNGKLYLSSISGPYRKKPDEPNDHISTSEKNMKYFDKYVLDLLDGLVNLPDEDLTKYRPYMREQLATEEEQNNEYYEEMVENEEYVEDDGNEQYEEEYNEEEMVEQYEEYDENNDE